MKTECGSSCSTARFEVDSPSTMTGNGIALLYEITHALERYAESGEATAIDLQRVPLSDQESDWMAGMLGKGEINATLHSMGRTTIEETGTSGVWRIAHYDESEVLLGAFIEVTNCPELLCTPAEDIREGAERLKRRLKEISEEVKQ
ncbi:MAG: hydrogenase expression/formation protein [Gammaproteobacteria bacterium]|nr:hydrogenase expression/formation protein [Gammaproteobacteria bacterium]